MTSTPAPRTGLKPCSAPKRPSHPAPGPLALVPVEFQAFYHLHHDRYLAYAQLHLPPDSAEHAVTTTFRHLLTHWRHVLGSPNPTAYAWSALTARTRRRARHSHRLADLSPAQYDAYVLHTTLGFTPHQIATTMGQTEDTIHSTLQAAHRRRG